MVSFDPASSQFRGTVMLARSIVVNIDGKKDFDHCRSVLEIKVLFSFGNDRTIEAKSSKAVRTDIDRAIWRGALSKAKVGGRAKECLRCDIREKI